MAQRVDRTPAAALEQQFQHNIAVVVGINRYAGVRRLNTAQPDAAYLADLLEDKAGRRDPLDRYQVTSFYDEQASCEQLTTYLTRTLPEEVRQAGGRTRVLFYFAGHGDAEYTDNTIQGYLFPQDAQPREQEESKRNLLPMAEVQKWLAELDCQHVLIILDCCSAGAMARSSVTRSALLPPPLFWETLQRFVSGKVRQLITSSAYNQKASDVAPGYNVGERDPDENAAHSPFAQALFAALAADSLDGGDLRGAGRDGVVTATELHLSISDALYRQVGDAQTPGLWTLNQGHEGGDYIFLLPGAQVQLEPAPDLTGPEHDPWPRSGNEQLAQALIATSREAAIRELIRRVEVGPLVAVTGRSSSDATGLVSDMLLPRLTVDAAAGSSQGRKAWQVVPPLRLASPAPVQALTDHVGQALGQERAENAGAAPGRLAALVAAWAAGHPDRRLLLAVDCAGALFDAAPAEERARLWALLGEAAQPDVLHIVLTVPNDRWEVPAQAPGQDNQPLLPSADRYEVDAIDPFNRDGLRQVIEQLAAARLIIPESETLIARLLDAVDKQPAALPLLTETLHRMYMRHANSIKSGAKDPRDRTLTQAYYEAEGGVAGVVADLAEQFYCQGAPGCGDTPPGTHQQSVQHVLMRLVAVENGRYVCGSAPLTAFEYPDEGATARAKTILKEMTALGLAASGTGAEGQSLVTLGHIALIEAWPRMQRWLVENGAEWDLQRQLAARMAEWQPQQPKSRLWADDPRLPLVEARLWPAGGEEPGLIGRLRWEWRVLFPRKNEPPDDTAWANGSELAFVRASVSERSGFRQRLFGIAATIVIVVSVLGGLAWWQRGVAVTNEQNAIRQSNASRSAVFTLLAQSELAQPGDPSRSLALILARSAVLATWRPEKTASEQSVTALLDAITIAPPWVASYPPEAHGYIRSADLSPAGDLVITGDAKDQIGRIWDIATGRRLAQLIGHTGPIRLVKFSHDGRRVLTTGDSGVFGQRNDTIRVWDAATGTQLVIMHGAEGVVSSIDLSPDDRHIASANGTGVQIWDARTGQELANLPIDGASGVAFMPGDRSVLIAGRPSNSERSFAAVYDIRTKQQILPSREFEKSFRALAFSRNAGLAALENDDGSVYLWRLQTPKATLLPAQSAEGFGPLAFDPSGTRLVIASGLGVYLWDVTVSNPVRPVLSLRQHTGTVLSVAFDSSGQRVFTSDGQAYHCWDAATGAEIPLPPGQMDPIMAMSFTQDRSSLVTLGVDGQTLRWNLSQPSNPPRLVSSTQDGLPVAGAITEDGDYATTADANGLVQVRDLVGGKVIWTENYTVNKVTAVDYSGASQALAAGDENGIMTAWMHKSSSALITRKLFDGPINSIRFDDAGSRLLVTGGESFTQQVCVIEAASLERIGCQSLQGGVWVAAFNPSDDRLIAYAGQRQEVFQWNADAGDAPIKLLTYPESILRFDHLSFTRDGSHLLTGLQDLQLNFHVSLWDLVTHSEVKRLVETRSNGRGIKVSGDGMLAATARGDRGLVDIWSLGPVKAVVPDSGTRWLTWSQADSHISSLAFEPSTGKWLVTGAEDGRVVLWDAFTGAQIRDLPRHSRAVNSVSFSADGTRVISAANDGFALISDPATGRQIGEALSGNGRPVTSATFSHDGSHAVITTSNGQTDAGQYLEAQGAQVWEVGASRPTCKFNEDKASTEFASFSPDDSQIVSTGGGWVQIWDTRTCKQVPSAGDWLYEVGRAEFSPNGKRLFVAAGLSGIVVWDTGTWKQVSQLTRPDVYVFDAAYSPDGNRLVSADDDKRVRVWDARTGDLLFTYNGHGARVSRVKFSPDGKHVASLDQDGYLHLWPVTVEGLLAVSERLIQRDVKILLPSEEVGFGVK